MPHAIVTPPRPMFWHEIAYAIRASNPRKEWDIDHIVNEIIRAAENSHHVPFPLHPVSVDGLQVDQLANFVKELKADAEKRTEPYVKRGVMRMRKQSIIKPIMIVGVASYPEPDMRDTAERRRWIGLVVDALRRRMEADGGRLVSVVLHQDEGFAHVHCILVSQTPGALVRSLNWAQLASDAEPIKSKKGEAYREVGGVRIQDWFFDTVGSKMGWLRKRVLDENLLDFQQTPPSPSRRLSRSQAQRNRQLQLENEAEKLRKRNIELEQRVQKLAAAQALHDENVRHFDVDFDEGERHLALRLEEIEAGEEVLKRDREQVEAIKHEYDIRKQRIEAEAAAQWRVIGEAVEKTKAWQAEVRDQVALEARVSTLRGKLQPGRGVGGWDDDLSDIPF